MCLDNKINKNTESFANKGNDLDNDNLIVKQISLLDDVPIPDNFIDNILNRIEKEDNDENEQEKYIENTKTLGLIINSLETFKPKENFLDDLLNNIEKEEQKTEKSNDLFINKDDYIIEKTDFLSNHISELSLQDNSISDNFIDNILSRIEKEDNDENEQEKYIENTKTLGLVINSLEKFEPKENFLDDLLNNIEKEEQKTEKSNDLFINETEFLSKHISGLPSYNKSYNFIENTLNKIDQEEKTITINFENYIEKTNELSIAIKSLETFKPKESFLNDLLNNIEKEEQKKINISNDEISEYLDNESNIKDLIDIEEALKNKKEYKQFLLIKKAISSLKKPIAPFNFSKQILDQVKTEKKQKRKIVSLFKMDKVSMVAGVLIAGIVVSTSTNFITKKETNIDNTKLTVVAEDYLFNSVSSNNSFDILVNTDSTISNTLVIEDIGL